MRTISSKRRWMAACLALIGLVVVRAAALAHEGHHHRAMGTVKLIHEERLVLALSEGKEQTFVLSEATKYLRGSAATTKGDVAAGERAVVMYESKEGAHRALEVKLGERTP